MFNRNIIKFMFFNYINYIKLNLLVIFLIIYLKFKDNLKNYFRYIKNEYLCFLYVLNLFYLKKK